MPNVNKSSAAQIQRQLNRQPNRLLIAAAFLLGLTKVAADNCGAGISGTDAQDCRAKWFAIVVWGAIIFTCGVLGIARCCGPDNNNANPGTRLLAADEAIGSSSTYQPPVHVGNTTSNRTEISIPVKADDSIQLVPKPN